jgi:hypothetical protein
MSVFRTKILGLAAIATAFAGVSYGQTITCGTPAAQNLTLRSEGQTELVGDLSASCTLSGATTTTGSVYATLSLPVTSKAVSGSATSNSDATVLVNGTAFQGTVTGNQVAFTGLTFPAAFTLTFSNIRVNATGGGAPQVTENFTVQYTSGGLSANFVPAAATNVGYILTTLGTTSLALVGQPPAGGTVGGVSGTQTFNSYTTCGGNVIGLALAAANQSFTVQIKELVAGAFKTQTQENGSYPATPTAGGIGAATSATLVTLTLGNVPASASVYVPISVTSAGTTLTIVNATAITSPSALVGVTGTIGPFTVFTPTSTGGSSTVTVTYTTTAAASTGAGTFNIPTFVTFAAGAAAPQGAMTVLVSYGPAAAVSGPASSIPTFGVNSATPVSASTVTLCQTSMLFPFVTNITGFETGLVLSNTSTDSLGTAGATSVKAQTGTCTWSFYGSIGQPTTNTLIKDPAGDLKSGDTRAILLSSLAPGFQGYAIATCPFQFAHGYAFIAYNLTQTNGAVQGYLAEVLPRGSSTPEAVTF